MVKPAKPFALFLWLRQHGSHHMCDVNYTVFTPVPSNGQFQPLANQSKLVALPLLWILSFDPGLLSEEKSEVKTLYWNSPFARGKRTKIVHPYVQISNTAMNALSRGQFGIECYDKLFLLQWQRSIWGGVSEVRNGPLGKPMHPRPPPEEVYPHFPQCSSIFSRKW